MKRILAAAAVSTMLATVPACYGHYSAFHKVHRWNASVSGNSWVRSGIHLGLWIVPVYELCVVGDFFIFNTIEHFTGSVVFD